jgi:hypothetical protein
MTLEGNLEYALTRVYARHGRRLDEAGWRRLETSRDLAHYIDAARSGGLAGWVASLDISRDTHAIERSLRTEWHRYVAGVASWHPQEWQAWLAWLAWLPDLSLLTQLSQPEPAPTWMFADPVLGPLAPGTIAERSAAVKASRLAPLERGISGPAGMLAVWRAHWDTLLPKAHARSVHLINAPLQTIQRYADLLATITGSSLPLRKELADRLVRLFRVGAGTVAVTVCHLALLALDIERLRGGLVCRHAFAGEEP